MPKFYRGDAKLQFHRCIEDLHENQKKTPVLILVGAPTSSPYRTVGFIASVFAVTAGIVTAAVVWTQAPGE